MTKQYINDNDDDIDNDGIPYDRYNQKFHESNMSEILDAYNESRQNDSLYENPERLNYFSNISKLSDVKAKTKLPEGTFKNKAETIKRIILDHAKDKTHAKRMIQFYISRAGSKLPNAKEVRKAKDLIDNCRNFNDLTERLKQLNQLYIVIKIPGKSIYMGQDFEPISITKDLTWKTGLNLAKSIRPFKSIDNIVDSLESCQLIKNILDQYKLTINDITRILSIRPNLKCPLYINPSTLSYKSIKKINNDANKSINHIMNSNFIEIAKTNELLKHVKHDLKQLYTKELGKLEPGYQLSNKKIVDKLDLSNDPNQDSIFIDSEGTKYYAIVYKNKFMWKLVN